MVRFQLPRTVGIVAAALVVAAAPVHAQGTLSVQGLGYAPGQLSTQALATGGSLGELDPLSPINPAALAFFGRGGLYFQYDPEFRYLTVGGKRENTITARFPVMGAAFGVGEHVTMGIGASTFLDRTFQSTYQTGQRLGPDSVTYTETYRSSGAINDVRLAAAWYPTRAITLGIGGHVLTGENRVGISRVFADTQKIGTLADTLTFSYTGVALSGGLVWRPSSAIAAALSARLGGTIRSHARDTAVATASVPHRLGGALRLDVVEGLALAASAEYNTWSRLAGLGQTGFRPRDGWDYGVGLELAGPRVTGASAAFRLGARRRTLPFDAAGALVRETDLSGGFGLPLAGGRAGIDVALQHANRTSSLDVKERAWTLSVGLAVRP